MNVKDNVFEILKDLTPKDIASAISEDCLAQYCVFIKKRILMVVENVDKEDITTDCFDEFQLYTKWGFKTDKGTIIPLHVCELCIGEHDGIEISLKSDSKEEEFKYLYFRHDIKWCRKNLIKL